MMTLKDCNLFPIPFYDVNIEVFFLIELVDPRRVNVRLMLEKKFVRLVL